MTEATLPWILLFGAIIVGAAGGWAFLAWTIRNHIRIRRTEPTGIRYTGENDHRALADDWHIDYAATSDVVRKLRRESGDEPKENEK